MCCGQPYSFPGTRVNIVQAIALVVQPCQGFLRQQRKFFNHARGLGNITPFNHGMGKWINQAKRVELIKQICASFDYTL
jgi:hypothetical protein